MLISLQLPALTGYTARCVGIKGTVFIFLPSNGVQVKLASLRDRILEANGERSVLDVYSSYDGG